MSASSYKPLSRKMLCPACGAEQMFKNTADDPTRWKCQGSGCPVSCTRDARGVEEPIFEGMPEPAYPYEIYEDAGEEEAEPVASDMMPSQWFEVTPVGVRILGDVPEDVWASTLTSLLRFRDALPWIIGDMIIHGEAHYGETYAQAIEATGRSYYTLSGYVRVCKAIPLEQRRADVKFSYHKVAAHHALPDPDRIELLDKVSQGSFENDTQFAKAVQERVDPERVVFKPETTECPICRHDGWDVQALMRVECSHCHAKAIEVMDLAESYAALREAFNALSAEYSELLSERTKVEEGDE